MHLRGRRDSPFDRADTCRSRPRTSPRRPGGINCGGPQTRWGEQRRPASAWACIPAPTCVNGPRMGRVHAAAINEQCRPVAMTGNASRSNATARPPPEPGARIHTLRTMTDARHAIEQVRRTGRPVVAILLSHSHPDHVGGAEEFHNASRRHPSTPLSRPDHSCRRPSVRRAAQQLHRFVRGDRDRPRPLRARVDDGRHRRGPVLLGAAQRSGCMASGSSFRVHGFGSDPPTLSRLPP
ncbi:MBL fold metallo-hydrolase [Embleya sp. NPDC050154]|uniref:MBL fold metallo-hydrolase n=1 Tax=Embleya sp. NPDC050154 TaxID=3363988 RepID=UPI00378CD525